jgi:uncharacterized protein YwqG
MQTIINREQIWQKLIDVGLGRVAGDIAQLARPCIRFRTTPSDDEEIPVGASKFGGLPDVPKDFLWPEWGNQPLSFLGQINLAAIAKNPIASPLPSSGLLSFFYDCEQRTWGYNPKDKGSWRVYFFLNQVLQRASYPASIPDYARYKPCTLSTNNGLTFPGWETLYIKPLNLTDEERELYWSFDSTEGVGDYGHQLLGHPQEVQGEMQLECQLVSNGVNLGSPEWTQNPCVPELEPNASQWTLLFQLDSDDNPGWMWGSVGCLYFWITESDLASQRFENVWMVLQCT